MGKNKISYIENAAYCNFVIQNESTNALQIKSLILIMPEIYLKAKLLMLSALLKIILKIMEQKWTRCRNENRIYQQNQDETF